MHRYFLLPALVFSLLIAALYSMSVLEDPGGTSREGGDSKLVQNTSKMEAVSVVCTRQGEPQWTVRSNTLEIGPEQVKLIGVEADVEVVGLIINAPSGDYDLGSGGLVLKGGVHMTGKDYVVKTPAVFLDSDSGELKSDSDVEMLAEGIRISGRGLRATADKIRILYDINAVIY